MKRKRKKERKKQKRSSTNEERSQSLTVPPGRELINKYNSLSFSLLPPLSFSSRRISIEFRSVNSEQLAWLTMVCTHTAHAQPRARGNQIAESGHRKPWNRFSNDQTYFPDSGRTNNTPNFSGSFWTSGKRCDGLSYAMHAWICIAF